VVAPNYLLDLSWSRLPLSLPIFACPNGSTLVRAFERGCDAASGARETSLATLMFTNYAFMNMSLSHKHLKLDQAKIDKARRLLGLATEQETLDRALDLVIAEEPILRAHRKVKGTGGVVDIFGHP